MSRSWPPTTSSTGWRHLARSRSAAGGSSSTSSRSRSRPGGVDVEGPALHHPHGCRDGRGRRRRRCAPPPRPRLSMFASTAASRSPRAIASFSAAAKAANAGVRSVSRLPPGGASSSERTASGLVRATSTATPAPNEDATRWHDVTPRWSSVSEHVGRPGRGRRPAAGRTRRSRAGRGARHRAPRVSPAHCGSHIRRSATPAWTSTTGMAPARRRRGRRRCRTV